MRFNCHAHIFTFRSVFTPETIAILISRLSREKWPAFATKAAEKALAKHLKGELLDEETLLREIVGGLKADQAFIQLVAGGMNKLPPSVTIALEGDIAGLPVGALREILTKVGSALIVADDSDARTGDLGDLLAFLAIGIKPSITAVADKLLEYSGPDTAIVALMMDITKGGDADEALFRQQIEDTAQASLAFPGRILPFVAVNPRRTLHYERMTHALEERGFVGVKLYPSLGFKIDTPEMRKVYAYCVAHDTPILLHCNRGGFYRDEQSIEYCDPVHWVPVLEKFPELRVCFGHFGGDENFIEESIDPGSWTGKILGLMKRYPGVYADISYHDEPMDGGLYEANYFKHLKNILSDPVSGKRVLFGSDFHLVRQRVRDDNLWRFFANRFSAAHFKLITETNPVQFLGLPGKGGTGARANVVRYLRFLAKYNLEVKAQPAEWALQAVKAELGEVKFYPNPFGSGWTQNNEAHFYTDLFFRDLMTKTEAEKLSFEQAGHLRMRDLARWPSEALPANIRSAALRQIATGLQAFLAQSPDPAAVLEKDTTSAQAREAFLGLLGKPDAIIAAFGPLTDRLYRFKSESA